VTTAPRKGRRRYSQLSRRDKIALTLFAGVPAVIHIVFVWVPAIFTVILSFMDWDGLKLGTWNTAGFANYWRVFTVFDNKFFPAFFNNLILLVFLSGCSVIGVLFAYLLDKNIRGTAIYQSVFYMPVVLSLAVVAFIWKGVMWSPSQGMFNVILGRTAQGDQIDWVGNAERIFTIHVPGLDSPLGLSKNFAAILIALAWRHIGYVMVLYLAGLKSVDPSLREAAAIDGCNEWQSFRRVVFPVMKPINVVVFVITVIEALRAFDIIFALKKPPGTQVLGILVRDNLVGEGGGHVGIGSAYGVILLLLCLGFIIWYLVNNYREEQL
jgi:multiple sugar transport system permease protein